VQVKNK